jgi:hypothetical protein
MRNRDQGHPELETLERIELGPGPTTGARTRMRTW